MKRSGERMSGEQLLEHVADIARSLASAESLDDTLQRIVDLGGDYIHNCEAASISFVRAGRITTPVYSKRLAYDVDQAQYDLGEGPCLTSIADHETIVIDDLGAEDRWPGWSRTASELGVRSSISFRLFVAMNHDDDDTMGALNMYATVPHAFDARSRVMGNVFASHAAVALKAAITESGLEEALRSRDVIGQAKGILMERERLSAGQAFGRLRELSNRHNRKVRDLAHDIAETGEVPS